MLLERGADVGFQGGLYNTALQAACASFCPQEELVRTLIDAGSDVNAQGGEYGSALAAALYRGSTNIMQLLLEAGADVNIQGGVYGNALQAACASPKATKENVQMLLRAVAEVNA